jgi:hypothetical protein
LQQRILTVNSDRLNRARLDRADREALGMFPSLRIPVRIAQTRAKIHTSCAVVATPTLDLAFAKWCFTVECDRPSRWPAAFSDPAASTAGTTTTLRSVA